MAKTTAVQLAGELTELNAELDKTLARYSAPGTGLSQRARAARRMAELYGRREALAVLAGAAFRAGSRRQLVEHLASTASVSDATRAEAWCASAEHLEAQAAELEQTTAAAFSDGMNYVPGRGRVRGL